MKKWRLLKLLMGQSSKQRDRKLTKGSRNGKGGRQGGKTGRTKKESVHNTLEKVNYTKVRVVRNELSRKQKMTADV